MNIYTDLGNEINVFISLLCSYLEGVSSRVHPRLLSSAAYDFPEKYDLRPFAPFRRRFKPYVRADEILKQVYLSGSVAVVTGASSGLGQYENGCVSG